MTTATETADQQIDRLAEFIMTEVPGEPSQSQGAVDTAIRAIRTLLERDKAWKKLAIHLDTEGGAPEFGSRGLWVELYDEASMEA